MPYFLISGIPELAAEVAAALAEHGHTVVEVGDIADVPAACAAAKQPFDGGYVQLPATFAIEGATAVERIRHYFADGVLARFPAVAAALPVLGPAARLTFVLGVLPPDVATDDDVAARAALVRVLARGAGADAGRAVGVDVLGAGTSPAEIARAAIGAGTTSSPDESADYADWRVELLGMFTVQV
jgi:hypothetical protein